MVINDFFSHQICGFNRHFGILFFKMCLCSSVDLMSFFNFLGKFSPNFTCHKIGKKNHDAGRGHYVVDGN
jgi:hypothetical protein